MEVTILLATLVKQVNPEGWANKFSFRKVTIPIITSVKLILEVMVKILVNLWLKF